MNFFETIDQLNPEQNNIAALIIEGDRAGEKVIWADGKIIYCSADKQFWINNFPANEEIPIGKIIEVDGQKIYTELLCQEKKLVICGAGHISIPVIKMGKMLGFHVTVIDDRLKFINEALAADADEAICDSFESALEQVQGDENTYFVVVTRGHRFDRVCLESIVGKKHAYIGMIGSRSRVYTQLKEMKEKGYDHTVLNAVHTPIGLDINAETPEEIAVSILSEIIQVKNERPKTSGYEKSILRAVLGQDKNVTVMKKVLVTIVGKQGSGPRAAGTKMIVCEDGTVIGTIGGGCVEAKIFQYAKECMQEEKLLLVEYDMSPGDAEEDGMACGGKVQIFLENIT